MKLSSTGQFKGGSQMSLSGNVYVDSKSSNRNKKSKIIDRLKKDYQIYLLALPAIIYVAIFSYVPMYGIQIAFKDFTLGAGISGSPWVGFENFQRFLSSYQFTTTLKNTIILSVYSLVVNFPFPVILALLLNQVKNMKFKKTVQTVTYAPHFISVVIMVSMLIIMLSPTSGVVNAIIKMFGGEAKNFMGEAGMFKTIYVLSDIWQQIGWSSIIYLAAIASINPELYEAAKVDGASKFKQILHVDLPGIAPTAIIMLILATGRIMSMGMQKAFLMQNPLNLTSSEIISTYIYKSGLLQAQYSYSAAVGLFESLVNVFLLVIVNSISKRVSETSLW